MGGGSDTGGVDCNTLSRAPTCRAWAGVGGDRTTTLGTTTLGTTTLGTTTLGTTTLGTTTLGTNTLGTNTLGTTIH